MANCERVGRLYRTVTVLYAPQLAGSWQSSKIIRKRLRRLLHFVLSLFIIGAAVRNVTAGPVLTSQRAQVMIIQGYVSVMGFRQMRDKTDTLERIGWA